MKTGKSARGGRAGSGYTPEAAPGSAAAEPRLGTASLGSGRAKRAMVSARPRDALGSAPAAPALEGAAVVGADELGGGVV